MKLPNWLFYEILSAVFEWAAYMFENTRKGNGYGRRNKDQTSTKTFRQTVDLKMKKAYLETTGEKIRSNIFRYGKMDFFNCYL